MKPTVTSIIIVTVIVSIIIYTCTEKKDKISYKKSSTISGYNWPPKIKEKVEVGDVSKTNYYIIFDGSGSMSGKKIQVAKNALKRFITLIPANANIGLTAFDKQSNSERAPLGSKKELIVSKVDEIRAGGSTPLGQSVEIAYKKLGIQANKQLGYGEYSLIIITDGQATDESRLKRAVKYLLNESPIVIHTIGFQIGMGHPLNQPGKIYYKTASNLEELSRGLDSVLAELEDFTVKKF
ncbi:VWA domain-containing protein [Spirochaetota bacterium]